MSAPDFNELLARLAAVEEADKAAAIAADHLAARLEIAERQIGDGLRTLAAATNAGLFDSTRLDRDIAALRRDVATSNQLAGAAAAAMKRAEKAVAGHAAILRVMADALGIEVPPPDTAPASYTKN
jgi:hypothetical protein